jgi:hypothetical protein
MGGRYQPAAGETVEIPKENGKLALGIPALEDKIRPAGG